MKIKVIPEKMIWYQLSGISVDEIFSEFLVSFPSVWNDSNYSESPSPRRLFTRKASISSSSSNSLIWRQATFVGAFDVTKTTISFTCPPPFFPFPINSIQLHPLMTHLFEAFFSGAHASGHVLMEIVYQK